MIAALIHRLVAIGGLVEGQFEVEDLAGVDLAVATAIVGRRRRRL